MNSQVTVSYALPMQRVWSGSTPARELEPRFLKLGLCVLNLTTWLYTAVATAGALA